MIDRYAMTAMAGPRAEKQFAGRWNKPGAKSDNGIVADMALRRCGSTEERNAYLKWLSIRVQKTLQNPQEWVAVEALAKALLKRKTLSLWKARKIIREAQDAACGLCQT